MESIKKYKSKIGWSIILFLAIAIGGSSAVMIVNHVWFGLVVNIIVVGLISYMFTSIYYVIKGDDLIVKAWFLINLIIKIEHITKIEETNNLLSSPAASLDRIAIYYNTSDVVMISPKEKMEFIRQLTARNTAIEVVWKKNKK
jgi:hypothetical protein